MKNKGQKIVRIEINRKSHDSKRGDFNQHETEKFWKKP